MVEIVDGRITAWEDDGGVTIRAAVPSIDRALLREYDTVRVEFTDGRPISAEQRKKIYAIFRDISDFTGYDESETKEVMKLQFITAHLESICKDMFSLANCSMTTAHDFLCFLIDFCLAHNIPTSKPLIEHCEDVQRYIFACAVNRKCAVCGKAADIHHLAGSRVGHGGVNWRSKPQDGVMFLPLCREHHIQCHSGEQEFLKRFHLVGIEMTRELQRRLGVKQKKEG